MEVKYSESIKQWREGLELAEQGTKQLEEAMKQAEKTLGPEATQATAEWDRTEDEKGRILFTIRLRDPIGEVSRQFPAQELESPNRIKFHMLRVWGDLLRLQTEAQQQKLRALLKEIGGQS